MKKFKRCTTTFLMALMVSAATAPQVMAASAPLAAANMPVSADAAMAQLRMEDKGPDLSKGMLISEFWGKEDDGTPYVERTYMGVANRISGDVGYTKTKNYGATGSVEVYGNFHYDSDEKTVFVNYSSGEFHEGGGISEVIENEPEHLKEGTPKASVKYSCRVNRNLGGWATYSVTVSCNYNGK